MWAATNAAPQTSPSPRCGDRSLNYRHAFHAGNFADIFKHLILVLLLQHLSRKGKPFRVLDTHAGAGIYDLAGEEALRTGEAQHGIEKFRARRMSGAAEAIAAPFRSLLTALQSDIGVNAYPGSPEIARRMLRGDDRLVVNEKHAPTFDALRQALPRDGRVRFLELDAWTALLANVPPKEKRGLVLIDPAFEKADEFADLVTALKAAWRKWPTGLYAVWYPVTQAGLSEKFCQAVADSGIAKILRAEIRIASPSMPGMNACGMIVINPPWTLAQQLEIVLPELTRMLARDQGAWRCDWLVPEKPSIPQQD